VQIEVSLDREITPAQLPEESGIGSNYRTLDVLIRILDIKATFPAYKVHEPGVCLELPFQERPPAGRRKRSRIPWTHSHGPQRLHSGHRLAEQALLGGRALRLRSTPGVALPRRLCLGSGRPRFTLPLPEHISKPGERRIETLTVL
jgi:hypothetical protein